MNLDIEVGQKVMFKGRVAECVSKFASGKFMKYNLDDGRFIHASLEDLTSQGLLTIYAVETDEKDAVDMESENYKDFEDDYETNFIDR